MSISPVRDAAGPYQPVETQEEGPTLAQFMKEQSQLMKEMKEAQEAGRREQREMRKDFNKRFESIENRINAHAESIEDLNETLKPAAEKEKTYWQKFIDASRTVSTVGGAALITLSLGSMVAAGAAALMVAPAVGASFKSLSELLNRLPAPQVVPNPDANACQEVGRLLSMQETIARYSAAAASKQALVSQIAKNPETDAEVLADFTNFVSNL